MQLVSFINKLGDTPERFVFQPHNPHLFMRHIHVSEISNQVKESKPRVLIYVLYMNLQWVRRTKVQTSKTFLKYF